MCTDATNVEVRYEYFILKLYCENKMTVDGYKKNTTTVNTKYKGFKIISRANWDPPLLRY